jgi:hypothetical protein
MMSQTSDMPSVGLALPKQFRQPRDVDGDPARLVLRQHLCLKPARRQRAVVSSHHQKDADLNFTIEGAGRSNGDHHSASRARIIAGLSGFFTLSQSRDGPDR